MEENIWVQIFRCYSSLRRSWLACWRSSAREPGTSAGVAVGVLMLLGGAVFNAVNLVLGDYAGFADQALSAG
jgi:hypothetical protein